MSVSYYTVCDATNQLDCYSSGRIEFSGAPIADIELDDIEG